MGIFEWTDIVLGKLLAYHSWHLPFTPCTRPVFLLVVVDLYSLYKYCKDISLAVAFPGR